MTTRAEEIESVLRELWRVTEGAHDETIRVVRERAARAVNRYAGPIPLKQYHNNYYAGEIGGRHFDITGCYCGNEIKSWRVCELTEPAGFHKKVFDSVPTLEEAWDIICRETSIGEIED